MAIALNEPGQYTSKRLWNIPFIFITMAFPLQAPQWHTFYTRSPLHTIVFALKRETFCKSDDAPTFCYILYIYEMEVVKICNVVNLQWMSNWCMSRSCLHFCHFPTGSVKLVFLAFHCKLNRYTVMTTNSLLDCDS